MVGTCQKQKLEEDIANKPTELSNQAMQPTAGRRTVRFLMTKPTFIPISTRSPHRWLILFSLGGLKGGGAEQCCEPWHSTTGRHDGKARILA